MNNRRFLLLAAGGLCLAVSASAGWLWHTLSETKYESHARLSMREDPFAEGDEPSSDDRGLGAVEERILSPELLAAAAALLRDRGTTLPLATPFDSETDFLLEHTRVSRPERGGPDEIRIACTAPAAEMSLQMLTAIVDATLEAAKSVPPVASDVGSDELEGDRHDLAQAIERQGKFIAALAESLKTMKAAEGTQTGDHLAKLETRRVEARRAVSEAERRLDEARIDLDKKVSAEIVVTRLAEGATRTKILDRLNLAKLTDDLNRQEALLQKSASIYGRSHPRMTELQGKIEQLKQQIAGFPIADGDNVESESNLSPATLVLNALELDLAEKQAAEQETEASLAARNDRLTAQQELESRLGEARQEFAFLHSEHDRLRRQNPTSRREEANSQPAVIEPPAISPHQVAPQAGLQMAVSCVAGCALYLLLLRQLRPRSLPQAVPMTVSWTPVSRVPSTARSTTRTSGPALAPALVQVPVLDEVADVPSPPLRRERFRSEEEERLARLKMLSTRG